MSTAAFPLWTAVRRLGIAWLSPWRHRRAAAPARHAAQPQRARAIADPAAQQAVAALKLVLDRHPKARKVFGHLALLEQGLRHLGADMLQRMSPGTLERARRQLASVADAEETRPLDELLQRAGLLQPIEPLPASDDFSVSRFSPEVSEGDPVDYFELMRAWQDTLVEEEPAPLDAGDPPGWHPTQPMPAPQLA